MTDWMSHFAAGAVFLGGLVLGASPARADLYKYRDSEGGIVITTEKRPNLELVEVLSGGGGGGATASDGDESTSGSSSSSEAAEDSAVSEAERRRARHRATDRDESDASDDRETTGRVGRDRFDDIIAEASESYDVPFSFIKAVIRVESDFQPEAVSHAGAMGLMQLMPKTADFLNVTDPFDPRQNIFGGTKFLRVLIDRYDGDINLILSAYNAGGAAVDEYEGIPYSKTRKYVASVYRWYKYYTRKTGNDEDAD